MEENRVSNFIIACSTYIAKLGWAREQGNLTATPSTTPPPTKLTQARVAVPGRMNLRNLELVPHPTVENMHEMLASGPISQTRQEA